MAHVLLGDGNMEITDTDNGEVLEEHPDGRTPSSSKVVRSVEIDAFLDGQCSKLRDIVEERFQHQTKLITDLRNQIQNAQFTQTEEDRAGRPPCSSKIDAFLDEHYSKLRDFIEERFQHQTELLTDLRNQIQYAQFTKTEVNKLALRKDGGEGIGSVTLSDMVPQHTPTGEQGQPESPQIRLSLPRDGGDGENSGHEKRKSGLIPPEPRERLNRNQSRSTSTVLRSGLSRGESNVSGISGKSRISHAVSKEQTHKAMAVLNAKSNSTSMISSEEELQAGSIKGRATRIVESEYFGYVVQFIILLNLILLGVEVDYRSDGDKHDTTFFTTVNALIVSFFIVEFFLRTFTLGCRNFFCGPERGWNIMDFLVILISVLETALELFIQVLGSGGEDNNSSYLRALRLARLARALRSVRVMRFLRYIAALRTIILSIISTMSPLLWTLAILLLLFYLFAVVITQMVTDYCMYSLGFSSINDCTLRDISYWSSVLESMLTLFKCITGGVSWAEPLEPLRTVSPIAVGTLLLYIVITVLAVLNVVTGVFCHTAIESAKADKDVAIMKHMKQHQVQKEAFEAIFQEIDSDSSEYVSLQELQAAMSNPKMASLMQSLDISTQDVWTLFMVLDENMDGCVTLDEFVHSCMRMQGPAKGLHLARMSYENAEMRKEITRIQKDLVKMERNVKQTIRSSTTMDFDKEVPARLAAENPGSCKL